jgi:hypothetical protein
MPVPDDLDSQLQTLDPATLDDVAQRADHLAAEKRRQERIAEHEQEQPDVGDRPEGVPSKASLTVKTINGNDYEYWQWRDGDSIKSKYHGPADAE